jgi:hypothetical protein
VSTADDLLAKVRDHAPTKRGRRKVFEPPTEQDFETGFGVCFDQTLTKTGWSVLEHRNGRLMVWNADVIVPEAPQGAYANEFERTFEKARQIEVGVRALLKSPAGQGADFIVHEMPAVQGYRLESSLMAALIIRQQAALWCPKVSVYMISRRSAYGTLVGGSDLEKRDGTATVNRLVQRHNTRRWNQDVHDSVLLGLKHLYDREHR